MMPSAASPPRPTAPSPPSTPVRGWRWDWRSLPAWAQALALFAASRVLFTFVAHRAADLAPPHPDGRPWRYLEIANNWDGTWYQRILLEGHPAALPIDSGTGLVAPNTWAFYPLFPRVVQIVMQVTGLEWTPAATLVAVGCGAGAIVVIRSVLARVTGPRTALWAVAFLCFFPSAPVLQLPYSESLALLLLGGVFWCLQRGRYLTAVPLLLLLGLSRPVAVPMAGVLTVHLVRQVLALRQPPGPLGWPGLARPAVAWTAACLAAVLWPGIAWQRTGVQDAYTQTMAAWRTPPELVPVRPWIGAAQHYFGAITGPVLLIAGVAALTWWLARRGPGALGPDLLAWCACYSAYLLAVLDSFTSLPRYLLPLFPLGALLAAASTSRAYRIAVTAAFAFGGVVWMLVIWRSSLWAP